ncbi:MAG TPA: aminotransferase class IV [Candidatus Acidoferrales bacterium]|nr:aminotransferase class IV [Candidatus Acidoferrales bacterium]
MTNLPQVAWLDGALVPWKDAVLHVDTQGVLGGLNVYEVVRATWSDQDQELYVFRSDAHFRRLRRSAQAMRMEIPFAESQLSQVVVDLLRSNAARETTGIRIVAYLGSGPLFWAVDEPVPTGMFMVAKPASGDARPQGINVAISSWRRLSDDSAPPRIKSGANYQNARLAQVQARRDGYDDAILLNSAGKVSEFPLANVFGVVGGTLVTPDVTSGILEGVTRSTVLELARELGIRAIERTVDRTELYTCEEAFATGSLLGVAPILSIDRYRIGDGAEGPITATLRTALEFATKDKASGRGWVRAVYGGG